jgi:hypothetical protein
MISIARSKMLFAAALCAVAAVSLTAGDSIAADKQKVKATRDQVAAACDANGGFQWDTGADGGRYGCMTENAWVECDANGNCEGGQASSAANRRSSFAGTNKLLQSME